MTLTDREILELNELCSAVIDETLTDQQQARLAQMLSTSDDARQFYIRSTGLSASLFYYAGERQAGACDIAPRRHTLKHFSWIIGALALAASIALVFWIASPRSAVAPTDSPTPDIQFVARLTGSKDSQWTSPALALDGRVSQGQSLELAAGFAEITFDSGAKVILQGPATFVVNSAWSATLNRGSVKATVPREAIGFSIANPTVKVVDLGTEFVMSAGAATDVLVLKGQVEATPHVSADQQPLLLNANESRRFASSGISAIPDSALKLDKWAHPVPLDHFAAPIAYAHWSFDESTGTVFNADAVGLPTKVFPAEIQSVPTSAQSASSALSGLHAEGRWKGALQFNGRLYAKVPFPSISENTPHTVAFWVKVPKDASLSNAYAMIAWNPNRDTLGYHPIHIAWNRNPDEGIVGVLRTDYGGGYAMGATPIRDDQWHHIAVVLIPRDNPKNPIEVKQYVDGRLEGEGRLSPPGSGIFKYPNDDFTATSSGVVWLGCRLGLNTVRVERFHGAIDELFITDQPLEPQEIIHLMTSNRL
jgi:hypothetical protein